MRKEIEVKIENKNVALKEANARLSNIEKEVETIIDKANKKASKIIEDSKDLIESGKMEIKEKSKSLSLKLLDVDRKQKNLDELIEEQKDKNKILEPLIKRTKEKEDLLDKKLKKLEEFNAL
jgi:hypothetical protein